ncbi:MAG: CxxxxCH/CxxCH domain-containing protein [Deltaproteobacteria bacterium]|nr:CxxxxCH/CxxCH domain-containing protein [Deltaproteobacteria bacterium]
MGHVKWSLGSGLLCFALFATFGPGCSRVVEPELPTSWKTEIGPLLASQCSPCHTGASADGSYRTTSYAAVLEDGTDAVSNAIAGDESSRLLTIFEEAGHLAHLGEGEVATERLAVLRRWVVEDELAYFWSAAHPPSILDPRAEAFHGATVAAEGWTLSSCRNCHGSDYRGGAVQADCTSCHQNSPEACDTCHGSARNAAPPRPVYAGNDPGAHQAHLTIPSGRFAALPCGTCHVVPASLGDAGHVDGADGAAEVTFGATATANGATPAYDATSGTCSGTYCHAGRSGGGTPAPSWTTSGGFTTCDGCHGAPPPTLSDGSAHPQMTSCVACHPATVNAAGDIIDVSLHGNGFVETRAGIDQCDGCHTGPGSPTPFMDTQGNTASTAPAVGAHDFHAGPSAFHAESGGTVGYACDTCHLVPTALGDAGHIDGGGAEVIFGGVATAKGATPTWDPASRTCSDVYCHGALLDGGGTSPTPAWNAQGVQTVCGNCHALPPAQVTSSGTPTPHPNMTTCSACHASVIDANFVFIDRSLHNNGQVDF